MRRRMVDIKNVDRYMLLGSAVVYEPLEAQADALSEIVLPDTEKCSIGQRGVPSSATCFVGAQALQIGEHL